MLLIALALFMILVGCTIVITFLVIGYDDGKLEKREVRLLIFGIVLGIAGVLLMYHAL